jgi:hypothetical protein
MGHKAIADLLKGEVNAEEKVDGSQFSFGVFEPEPHPQALACGYYGLELKIRSKGAVMIPDAPEKMFTKAAESVKERLHLLHPGWTYRGEYLAKPKHNALAYDRHPKGHIIIFDVNTGEEEYLDYEAKVKEAQRIGLETVPRLFEGRIGTIEEFRRFLESTSILGGQKIEGVVVKPVGYNLFGRDKKCLMGKFVSEAYKEVHSKAWRADNPSAGDIIAMIGSVFGTQARWNKAIQHLRERGLIEDDVRDIGLIMREIPEDIKLDCEDEIKEKLFSYAWPHIRRMVTRGVPEYYKDLLLKRAFETHENQPEQVDTGVEDVIINHSNSASGVAGVSDTVQ